MNTMHANPVGNIRKDIYIIKNDINDKVYIGQSLSAEQRFKSHCKGNYDNSIIDAAIQKYGKEHFYYEILESQIENYNEREAYWIKQYNSIIPNGYNILEGGQEPPRYSGELHPTAKLSDEEVEKIAEYLINTTLSLKEIGEEFNISKRQVLRINQGASRVNPNWDYPLRKTSNINGKLTEENVDEIIELLKYSYLFNGEIARRYGVEVHTISDINLGYSHYRKEEHYPIREWKSCGVVLFTYEEVTDIIYKLSNTKESISSIARSYNVGKAAITQINQGTSKKYRREGLHYPLRKF